VETAPYILITADKGQNIEVRHYPEMVLVSTTMNGQNGYKAFRKLFAYIAGDNAGATEIAMTAPVLMDDKNMARAGAEIAMTAPVLMKKSANNSSMSFVMPKDFTLQTTPKPMDPTLSVSELEDYHVAAIQFSGTMSDSNLEKNRIMLTTWLVENGYTAIGEPVRASYNGPFTLPMLRRNELLIEVASPSPN
jgi:hypothetical protein